jgi:uncharacterized membrane protein
LVSESRVVAKMTIIEALPDEAKDLKKQKASRLRKKQQDSAAVSAALSSARNKKEIVIDRTEAILLC